MRVGIIGAGIAGLTLATRLVEAGHSTLIVDKGRGVGGRAATRRKDDSAFDHGAQYFTCRGLRFRAFLDEYVPESDRAVWEGRFATLDEGRLVEEVVSSPRFVGVPGMSSIARSIAKALDVVTGTRVVRLGGSPGRWSFVDADGREEGPFDWVVSTAPPIQTAALLGVSSSIAEEAGRVAMQPCFALMLAPTTGAILPFDGIRCRHPILGWAANDHSKPGRGPRPALVIQSNQEWAGDHVNDELSTVARALVEAASEAFGVDLGPTESGTVHRWLYAKPLKPLGRPYLIDGPNRMAACGDWCVSAKVEGAFLSGDACALALIG